MSVPWAPPEQLVGMRSANPASDVYSLGATTFAMLTGRSPFEVDGAPDVYELSRRIVKDPLPPLGRQDAPPSLHRVLSVAMDKNPESRYPTALAFARALQQVQAELDLPITTVDLFHEAEATTARPQRPEEEDEATHMGVFSRVEITSDGMAMRVDDSPGPQLPRPIGYDEESEEEAAPARESRWRLVVAIVAGLVLVALVIGAIVVAQQRESAGGNSTFQTIAPPKVSPVEAAVEPPTNLRGEVEEDGSVVFTWDAPSPEWKGSYLYREVVPGEKTDVEPTKTTTASIPARSGRTCLEVSAVRDDGKSSPSVTACIDTP